MNERRPGPDASTSVSFHDEDISSSKLTGKFSGPRLYTRQVIGLVGIFLLMGIVFVLLSMVLSRHDADIVSQAVNRDLANQVLVENPLLTNGQINDDLVSQSFDYLMRVNPSIEAYLIDLDGTIRNFSAEPAKVKRDRVAVEPIVEFLANPDKFPILGDDPRSTDKTKVFSVTPLVANGASLGYLYVVLRGENVDLVQRVLNRSRAARSTALAVGLSMLGGLITSLLLFGFLGRRLTALADRIAKFELPASKLRNLNAKTVSKPQDEVELLESTFESMSSRIRDQLHELADTDESRRELIARVSHDLRTPLSVLRTHIESLQLRYLKLTHEQRLRHISTANREIVHLNKLVDDLFDLSRLEARERSIETEPVCLSDLVQDVVHKHRLRASDVGIELLCDIDEDFLWTEGEISSLERMLDNLVTNAIQYSPTGKSVHVGLTEVGAFLELVVHDQGPGIPPKDHVRVFEPFFRTNQSLKDGTGLGLSIAKRVAEIHRGTIQVVESDTGARLLVRLPNLQHHG